MAAKSDCDDTAMLEHIEELLGELGPEPDDDDDDDIVDDSDDEMDVGSWTL